MRMPSSCIPSDYVSVRRKRGRIKPEDVQMEARRISRAKRRKISVLSCNRVGLKPRDVLCYQYVQRKNISIRWQCVAEKIGRLYMIWSNSSRTCQGWQWCKHTTKLFLWSIHSFLRSKHDFYFEPRSSISSAAAATAVPAHDKTV